MRDPRRGTLVIEQGVTNRRTFRLRNKYTGAVLDPVAEGYTAAKLQVRDKTLSEGGTVLLELSTENGGIVLGPYTDDNGKTWSGRLYISQAATKELTPWGEGVYDLLFTHSSGQVDKGPYGTAELIPNVTEV